jgi:uncharacterized protein (TIGR03382 family)
MTRTLIGTVFALLLAGPAAAERTKGADPARPPISETMQGPQMFDCNAGGPAGLVVALAAVGLATRRRR